MQLANSLTRQHLVPFAIMVFGALACSPDPTELVGVVVSDVSRDAQAEYASCPDAATICRTYHGDGSVPTSSCQGVRCFEMNYGTEVRVVAADGEGSFPSTFFVWHNGTLTPAGSTPCVLTNQNGKKTRLEVLASSGFKCRNVYTGTGIFYEHFASNPSTGCLAWLECSSQ